MAERKVEKKSTPRFHGGPDVKASGFSAEELAAMRERGQELKRAGKMDRAKAMLEKIAEMPEPDRSMAKRLQELIAANVPALSPTTWYGMPAWAKGGKVVCFFQGAAKFKTRYATLGFTDQANLDDGPMWPTSFALTALTPDAEKRIIELLKKAVG